MSKSKAQGTRWESEFRRTLEAVLDVPVVRLVEGGAYDRGDLAFRIGDQEFVVECRDRETMQVHKATEKARRKASPATVFVAWKRKRLEPGNTVRTQVGQPVAILPLADLVRLLAQLGKDQNHE